MSLSYVMVRGRRSAAIAGAFSLIVSTISVAQQSGRAATAPVAGQDWASYGRDPGGSRYSPLSQISRANVGRLAPAWHFSTGEAGPDFATDRHTSFEATPLVIGGIMYFSTPLGRVFALEAGTGRELWRYNSGVSRVANFGDFTSRGVSYWVDRAAPGKARCRERIVYATVDARLIALDARDGATCLRFGDGGTVDLRRSLRNKPFELAEYAVTSPPAVIGNILVVGSAVADNNKKDAASGEVRGYDARTGALRWTFDPVPQREEDPAYSTWRGSIAHRTGAANAWSVIAADVNRGLVFVPTSTPSPDYYGGERLGDNRYANSVVALRAATGEVAWSFQTVHHDIWDYDNASPPALVTVRRGGREIPAVLQATKSGMLFVLDRETGVPVVPVEERPVPASDVKGESASPTQPFSTLPALVPSHLDPAQVFGVDSADRAACRAAIAGVRQEGIFTPASRRGTLAMPSNIGGAHWGGVAFDPATQIAVIPVNELAALIQLFPRDSVPKREDGWEYGAMRGTPYVNRRRLLISPGGVPCTPPPFGSLVAINVEKGTLAWRVPLGTPPRVRTGEIAHVAGDSATQSSLGSPNLGGAIVTAGGLVFIGATLDAHLRAFDVESGRELWRGPLPAGGKATPMTYAVNGRQFVAIAAGGDGGSFGKGDEIVVFALPDHH